MASAAAAAVAPTEIDEPEDYDGEIGMYTQAVALKPSTPIAHLVQLVRMDELHYRTDIPSLLEYMVLLLGLKKAMTATTLLRREFVFVHANLRSSHLIFEASFWLSSLVMTCCKLMHFHTMNDYLPRTDGFTHVIGEDELFDISAEKAKEHSLAVMELCSIYSDSANREWKSELHIEKTKMDVTQKETLSIMDPTVIKAKVAMLGAMLQLYKIVEARNRFVHMKTINRDKIDSLIALVYDSLEFIKRSEKTLKDPTTVDCLKAAHHVLYTMCSGICKEEEYVELRYWCIQQSDYDKLPSTVQETKAAAKRMKELGLKEVVLARGVSEPDQFAKRFLSLKPVITAWPAYMATVMPKWTLRAQLPAFSAVTKQSSS